MLIGCIKLCPSGTAGWAETQYPDIRRISVNNQGCTAEFRISGKILFGGQRRSATIRISGFVLWTKRRRSELTYCPVSALTLSEAGSVLYRLAADNSPLAPPERKYLGVVIFSLSLERETVSILSSVHSALANLRQRCSPSLNFHREQQGNIRIRKKNLFELQIRNPYNQRNYFPGQDPSFRWIINSYL